MSPKNFSRIPFEKLSNFRKAERKLALDVLRLMRLGNSFSSSTKEAGLSSFLSKKHLGRYIKKIDGRFVPTKTDSIQRRMQIYSSGRIKSIVVRNSKDASLIGKHYNEIRKTTKGNSSGLKRFKKITIIDAKGKKHKLETDPKKIFEIEDRKEDAEFFEVYEDE